MEYDAKFGRFRLNREGNAVEHVCLFVFMRFRER